MKEPGNNVNVLLIEDDPMVQEVNRQMIEKMSGFQVIDVAGNGKEGIELAKIKKPDLVFLDIFMPELDGIKTISAFRRDGLDIDVIIISAADDKETIRKSIQYGAIDYIIKPFKFERLEQALLKYNSFVRQFSGVSKTQQDDIDAWISQKPVDSGDALIPKGLNRQTLSQVRSFLSKHYSPASADETAASIGIARVTARRYLDYLVKADQAAIHMQYGDVGRPVNRYYLR